jgi:5,5'-dehydrodivanillate O-demethylase
MADETDAGYEDLVHVGPGTLAGRYLRMFWQPVARSEDLAPGQVKPIKMLGERLTLYRGSGGAAHLTEFTCAHRGTQLSIGWVEDDCIRCRYHGWLYDASGQCIEVPGEGPAFTGRIRIRTYPVHEYVGLIFAYLGEGEPPSFRQYPDLDLPGVIVVDPPEVLPCNFWNRLDNDNHHIPWTHRSTATRLNQLFWLAPREPMIEETPYGFVTRTHPQGQSPHASHFHMPNTNSFPIRSRARGYEGRDLWDTKFTWTVPIDDDHFVAFDVTRTPLTGEEAVAYAARRKEEQEPEAEMRWDVAEAILRGDYSIEQIPDEISHYNGFAIEDYATQVGQGQVDRSREHLGQLDRQVVMKRGLWLRDLKAVAEGRPPQPWQTPAEPLLPANLPAAAGAAEG